jgi:hypothetical protein
MISWKARSLASLTFTIFALAFAVPVMAANADLAGVVWNDASWADYSTQRCATHDNSPSAQVNQWPGSTIYLAIRYNGVRLNPATYAQNDSTWRQLAYLYSGSCFYMSAHRDTSWDWWNSSSWAGKLNY